MTRDGFIGRVADLLRRSGVDDAERLINLLEGHVRGAFPPGCGAFAMSREYERERQRDAGEEVTAGVCARDEGHDGYHKDKDGYGWQTV